MARPVGTTYLRFDAPLIEEMRQMIEPTPLVPTLRQAAKLVAPRAHNYGYTEPELTERRLVWWFRQFHST